jgi:predicted nuclease of restriction endonuclease-like (RecB) superfamily
MASREKRFLPQAVAEIPWGHNVTLLEKLKDSAQRTWYARQATANGWSRSMLDHWIESDLYSRQGKAVTNFKQVLSAPQSDLANEIVRDPYNFDFLALRTQVAERELENGLLTHIRKFLIELGAGFAFVGQQVHLPVDGENFYIDLLFYHLKLRCYIVIDLKTTPFKPEYAGKMNFYLSAVDDQLRQTANRRSRIMTCPAASKESSLSCSISKEPLKPWSMPSNVRRRKPSPNDLRRARQTRTNSELS